MSTGRWKGERKDSSNRRWIERNWLKHQAHSKVASAVRDGKLIPQPCEVCGRVKAHAHHEDYTKPLEVRWLCSKHHKEAHGIKARTCKPAWSWAKRTTLSGEAASLRDQELSYLQIGERLGISKGHAFKIVNQTPYK